MKNIFFLFLSVHLSIYIFFIVFYSHELNNKKKNNIQYCNHKWNVTKTTIWSWLLWNSVVMEKYWTKKNFKTIKQTTTSSNPMNSKWNNNNECKKKNAKISLQTKRETNERTIRIEIKMKKKNLTIRKLNYLNE